MPSNTIIVYSDFAYTEQDIKRFFQFCGDIISINLKFNPDTVATAYLSEVTFKGSVDSALLLDGGILMGHTFRLEKQSSPGSQDDQNITFVQRLKQVPSQVTASAKDLNEKYQITKKAKKAIFSLPGFLMRPCMKKPDGPKISFGSSTHDMQ